MTDQRSPPLHIGFIIFPDFQIIDLTGPLSVFEIANELTGTEAYRLRTLSISGGMIASSGGLAVASEPVDGTIFDTVVVVGGNGSRSVASDHVHSAMVKRLDEGARRVASICTGAFVLGGAGLLDGRRATTHWRYASSLQKQCPAARIEPDQIFVRHGRVWSSAGATAGIDLALALIEEDFGADLSRAVAQELVVYHRRPGGQSQFSAMLELEPSSDRIHRALLYAREHLAEPLSVGKLAEVAALSERQFGRAFRAETGETPARAIERLRVEAARTRLENGRETIECISDAVGFSDTERMRRAFLRVYGQPPQALRRAWRGG
ncbi:AraC family transcriptional regulator [Sphingomonas sp. Root710]|uniref:GlxA family transcriptional regulator n=1 Tax=Sphingomonas sp. Root710 TaxID=1736594 RepID=UPI0006F5E1CF|nr:GlxA family transcriptional regulator [Sphingomonas sp. Root710]KRB85504.1 AraC family transcriptional regulator [Sphingomonas sp. Root710]